MKCEHSGKRRILEILRMFQEQTDARHGVSMAQIIDELRAAGIRGERKAIYNDFEILRACGLDIQKRSTRPVEYCLANRKFSSGELALIIDAVQSCKFITPAVAREMSVRLASLACEHSRAGLQRNIHVDAPCGGSFGLLRDGHAGAQTSNQSSTSAASESPTTENTTIESPSESAEGASETTEGALGNHVLDNVSTIHDAMHEKKRINFTYWKMGLDGAFHAQHGGRIYEATPMRVSFAEGFYYLTAWAEPHSVGEGGAQVAQTPAAGADGAGGTPGSAKRGSMREFNALKNSSSEKCAAKRGSVREYRIDRMRDVCVSAAAARRYRALLNYEYKPRNSEYFGRFDGELVYVGLKCDASGVNIVADRFGADAKWSPASSSSAASVSHEGCDADHDSCAQAPRATAHVHVRVSPQFFGWVAGLGGKVQIATPKKLLHEYKEYLKKLIEL